jgi:nitric oxide reductase NorD protein
VSKTAQASRFTLLARAVAGRTMFVVEGDNPLAYTDGECIFLPVSPADLQRCSVIAQAGLIGVGSFDRHVMARIAGRHSLQQRYLLLECVRAVTMLKRILPLQISELTAAMYDGPAPSCPQESLAWARQARCRLPVPPDWIGTIKPMSILRAANGTDGRRADHDDASASREEWLREFDDDEESDRSRILELFSAPIQTPLSSMITRFFGMGRAPEGNRHGGAETPVGGHGVGPVGSQAKPVESVRPVVDHAPALPVGFRYREWDSAANRYRPNWCTVAEFDPPQTAAELRSIPDGDRLLRRELARLGLSHERHRRQQCGDTLDLTALVNMVVQRSAGVDARLDIYECMRRTAHDLSVLVLLDATSSTRDAGSGWRVFDQQREVARRLTAALDELGCRVALFGFFSQGRNAVRFMRIKDFDDRYDSAVHQRLCALEPSGFTRLGAAVRHASHLLKTRAGTSQRLLVLVGDGFPYEEDYEGTYAEQDSRQALHESVTTGIGCACVSVGSATRADVIQRVWGEFPHCQLDDVSELAPSVIPLLRASLRRAKATSRSLGSTDGQRSLGEAR